MNARTGRQGGILSWFLFLSQSEATDGSNDEAALSVRRQIRLLRLRIRLASAGISGPGQQEQRDLFPPSVWRG